MSVISHSDIYYNAPLKVLLRSDFLRYPFHRRSPVLVKLFNCAIADQAPGCIRNSFQALHDLWLLLSSTPDPLTVTTITMFTVLLPHLIRNSNYI